MIFPEPTHPPRPSIQDPETTASSPLEAETGRFRHPGRPFPWLGLAAGLLLARPALAIPSPDVVIGVFASAAQGLGLLSVMIGGALFAGQRRRGGGSGQTSGQAGASSRVASWCFRGVLVLLLVSLGANALQYASRADARSRRLQRNLVRSSAENGVKVGDTNLKTLSFSAQQDHPLGLTTEQLAQLLATGQANLIDVREPEEIETGRIAGAQAMRYPDVRRDGKGLEKKGKTTVLLCYSGNRSSELCDELSRCGISGHFLIGGYEKWITEGRPLALPPGGRGPELRSLADFPGKERLLDTAEVERLVRERHAIFVDVRYEGDFAADHLPGAIDLPLRKLPTAEMERVLATKIPAGQPVIAPCYDKRSSFYALILGLRLQRRGREFLGRYTVPHEYLVAKTQRPFVASWHEMQHAGIVSRASAPLRDFLSWLDSVFGHLALAIVAAVILLRVCLLPLTLRGERDQIVTRGLAPEIARLKAASNGDRSRHARALLALHRKHGIHTGRGLLASLTQLFLFLLFFAALSNVAAGSTDGLFWLPSLADPDPIYLLPAFLGVLVLTHLQLNAARRGLGRELGRLLGTGALVAITFRLPAALNLYLVLNVGLMMLQNRLVCRWLRRHSQSASSVLEASALPARGVTPLSLAHRVPGCGNKALRLAQLQAAGLPVPDGFVITSSLLEAPGKHLTLAEKDHRAIDRQWRRLKAEKVAVRSSGLNEDGEDQSYAGVFESVLDVRKEGLLDALEEVRASLHSMRATAYSQRFESGGVLVQAMVDAEYAGVLFTEHPCETGSMLVELVSGLGDSLVSGQATPDSYRLGRLSGNLLDGTQPPIEMKPLVRLGRRIERLFGKPQDIEWAYHAGRFLILQARDITVSVSSKHRGGSPRAVIEHERSRVLELAAASAHRDGESADEVAPADEIVFEQNELSELLPSPTPLSLSLMESLWASGGSTDLACRDLGISFDVGEDSPPMVANIFGRLYVNRLEEQRRLARGPGMIASFRLARCADDLEQSFREGFLPDFLREVRLRETMDLSRLEVAELVDLFEAWLQRFLGESYVQAELINIAADFYVKTAEQKLQRHGLASARHLAQTTIMHEAMSMLAAVKAGERSTADFLALFGHRAPIDYELSAPRYAEDPALVATMVARAGDQAPTANKSSDDLSDLPASRLLRLAVQRAKRFQALKEEAKHHCLRELALLRRVLLQLDRALGLQGGIFYLRLAELVRLKNPDRLPELQTRIARRRAREEVFEDMSLPTRLRLLDLESSHTEGGSPARSVNGELAGMLVAGDAGVAGPARVITHPDEIDSFEDGEILVARFTDPTWTPLFPRAKGVVTEVGGRLSHAAIVAREYNVTTIVGVLGAVEQIHTGDLLKLDLDGSIRHTPAHRNTPVLLPRSEARRVG